MTLRSFLAVALLVAVWERSAAGQSQTPPNTTPAASGQAKAAPLPSTLPKSQMHPATRPPLSNRVAPEHRLSTAQRMAIVGDKPAPKVLPVVTASDAAGHRMAAHTATPSQHWLLLYREQNCAPCDRLMNALAASQSPNLKKGVPYVVLVAGHQAAAAEQVRVQYGTLSDATWLTDQEKQFAKTVKPRGTPTLYAMDGDKVVWSASGTESNPARVEQLVSAWLADMAAKDGAAAKREATTSSAVEATP
jgi:hypothetical protein